MRACAVSIERSFHLQCTPLGKHLFHTYIDDILLFFSLYFITLQAMCQP